MSDFLRFPFNAADLALIDTTTLTFDDSSAAVLPRGTVRIKFTLADATKRPQVRPFFPGQMRFVPDKTLPGSEPDPVAVVSTNYGGWRTQGTLIVDHTGDPLKPGGGSLDVMPTTAWYGPVVLTRDFLFTTLPALSAGSILVTPAAIPGIGPGEAFVRNIVSSFLKGRLAVRLRAGKLPSTHDVASQPMPEVAAVSGLVTLDVTFAERSLMSGAPAGAPPTTAGFEIVPARWAYTHALLRDQLLDVPAIGSNAAALLDTSPGVPRYWALRFSRAVDDRDAAAYFSASRIEHIVQGDPAITTAMPRNSLLFLRREAAETWTSVSVALTSPSAPRLLLAVERGEPLWQTEAAANIALDLDLSDTWRLQVRVPMSVAMLEEPAVRFHGQRLCTFTSFRRTLRTVLSNRVLGRPFHGSTASEAKTVRRLVNALGLGFKDAADLVPDGPTVKTDEAHEGVLMRIAQTLYPGATKTDGRGWIAQKLWYSAYADFHHLKGYEQFFGYGAPGAIEFLGLGTRAAQVDYTPEELLTLQLKPGALLQFWLYKEDFERVKNGRKAKTFGHSLVFMSSAFAGIGQPTIRVIDQNADYDLRLDSGRLMWDKYTPEVWIAAHWND